VRVGSTATDNLCLIATGLVVLRPWEPGDPFPSPYDPVPVRGTCKGTPPIRLHRARHMTVTLLGQAPSMGARWFEGSQSRPIAIRPVGVPPTATWFLRLPRPSGRLVLRVFFPPSTLFGGVTQGRSDYKISIRRTAKPETAPATPVPTAPSVAEPVIPTDSTPVEPVPPPPTFADSGTH
jgi:hypothetical protein